VLKSQEYDAKAGEWPHVTATSNRAGSSAADAVTLVSLSRLG
jgi:hypothetical protein